MKRWSSSDANDDTDERRDETPLRETPTFATVLPLDGLETGPTGVLGRLEALPRLYAEAGMIGGPIELDAGFGAGRGSTEER